MTSAKMFFAYYYGFALNRVIECYVANLTLSDGVTLDDLYGLASCQWLNDAKQ